MNSEEPRPHVIIHASMSVDGATTGFLPHLGQHYGVAASFNAQANLIGSATMLSGLQHSSREPSPDPGPELDRPRRADDDSLPYWVIVDSHGHLMGRLHELRAFPMVREVVVLTSHQTPEHYRIYLNERGYPHYTSGDDHVYLRAALAWLRAAFGIETVLVDSGPILSCTLLDHGLINEISLLVQPVAVGSSGRRLFESSPNTTGLELISADPVDRGVVHLRYRVP